MHVEKIIALSEEDIAILLDLLGKVQNRGLNLVTHAGELKAIREIEAVLENASDLRYEKDYRAKVDAALAAKWDAGLIRLDFRRIPDREALFSFLAGQLDFPVDPIDSWESFDQALIEHCGRDQVILLQNKEKMHPGLAGDIRALEKSIVGFNRDSKHKIEILG